MKDTELYDRYERTLEDGLVKICRGAGLVGDMLLRSDDIDARWDDYIKDYVADAVENFNQYPEAAISWAGFLGIGVAHWWDADWQGHKDDPYRSFYGSRGWDDMDEHVLRDLLGLRLDGKEAKRNLRHPAQLRPRHPWAHTPRRHRDADGAGLLRAHPLLFGAIPHRRRNRTPAPRIQSRPDQHQAIGPHSSQLNLIPAEAT